MLREEAVGVPMTKTCLLGREPKDCVCMRQYGHAVIDCLKCGFYPPEAKRRKDLPTLKRADGLFRKLV